MEFPTTHAAGGTTPRRSASAIGRRRAPRSTAPRRSPLRRSCRPTRSANGTRAALIAATSSRAAWSSPRFDRFYCIVRRDHSHLVMAGLVPVIHVLLTQRRRGCPAAQTSLRSLRKLDCDAGMTEAWAPTLQAPPVEAFRLERAGVDVVEAAHVHRHHLLAARRPAAGKRTDPALRAEEVVNGSLAELIIPHIVGAGAQRKLFRRHE